MQEEEVIEQRPRVKIITRTKEPRLELITRAICLSNVLFVFILWWWLPYESGTGVDETLRVIFWSYSTQPVTFLAMTLYRMINKRAGVFSMILLIFTLVFAQIYYHEFTRLEETAKREEAIFALKSTWRSSTLVKTWGIALKKTESHLFREFVQYIDLKKQQFFNISQ